MGKSARCTQPSPRLAEESLWKEYRGGRKKPPGLDPGVLQGTGTWRVSRTPCGIAAASDATSLPTAKRKARFSMPILLLVRNYRYEGIIHYINYFII